MFMTPQQVKAARALLGWNAESLANRASIPFNQVRNFESGRARSADVMETIYKTLAAQGIEFVKGGVVLNPDVVTTIEGGEWYLRLLDDVYETLIDRPDAEMLLFYAADKVSPPAVNHHLRKMRNAGIRMRQLVEEGDTYLMGALAEYRYIPKERFKNYVSLVYGDKVAVCTQDNTKAIVFQDAQLAWTWRNTFEILWGNLKKPDHSDAEHRF